MFIKIGIVILGTLSSNNQLFFWNGQNWKSSAINLENACIYHIDDPRLPSAILELYIHRAQNGVKHSPTNVAALNIGMLFSDDGMRFAVTELSEEDQLFFESLGLNE